jgi:beta-glucosidase/6-phospho-beta-glucosidase/beta-galactosidase
MLDFLFATGIENSYPVIRLPDGSRHRVDEMAKCGHYDRWRHDFALAREIGCDALRFGPPYYATHLGPGRYDWSFADDTFGHLAGTGLTPIVDLCHFGVPDWAGDFQNPDWPALFTEYARAFAVRFPHLRFYTPINEIFITARFSAELGWWNERLTGDRPFVTALKHLCQANLLAMRAILEVQPDAVFVQSESSEYFHAEDPSVEPLAHLLNQKRFLALDLTYGYPVRVGMYEYLLDHGMTREEYHWFERNQVKARCVMGNDYYVTNEHLVRSDGVVVGAGEIFGYYVITHQYYSRYHLPVMHTETNLGNPEAAPAWLRKQWANIQRLRLDGVPILGFTWYSLTDQVDWDTALREDNGRLVPCGLYDLDRRIRPVGEAYRTLIAQWRDVLPGQGMGVGARW